MQLADVAHLPPTLTTEQAAEMLGVSRDHLWALQRAGEAPIEPLRLGRALRWPTARLAALLGLDLTTPNPDDEGDRSPWQTPVTITPAAPDAQPAPD